MAVDSLWTLSNNHTHVGDKKQQLPRYLMYRGDGQAGVKGLHRMELLHLPGLSFISCCILNRGTVLCSCLITAVVIKITVF